MYGFRPHIYDIRPLFDSFWNRAPALFYGLFCYLGCIAALSFHYSLFLPVAFLSLYASPIQRLRLGFGLTAMLLFWFYVSNSVSLPPPNSDTFIGKATFEITDLTHDIRYMRPYCKMTLFLHSFEAHEESFFAQNIPCKLVWNQPSYRPKANFLYEATATLSEHNGQWSLKLEKDCPVVPIKSTFSLVEWRFAAKNFIKQILAVFIPPTQTRVFLEGVLLGEFHDSLLASDLRRFGLQHITVVSGFHFSLIAVILAAFFRLILPWKATNVCLLIATTAYLLFIGPSASVIRAYVAVAILLVGKLLERNSNGLNCLGIGLLVVLVLDPTSVTSLGFTLSFLATFAILLLYPRVEYFLRSFFPHRTPSELVKMSFSDQLVFVLLAFFLSSIALVTSVSILMLPMSLYCFHSFPLMGMVYNCFFPFLVSMAVFVLFTALLFLWFQPLAALLFSFATSITDSALTLVTDAPKWLDVTLTATWLSLPLLVFYLCLASFIGIILDQNSEISQSNEYGSS